MLSFEGFFSYSEVFGLRTLNRASDNLSFLGQGHYIQGHRASDSLSFLAVITLSFFKILNFFLSFFPAEKKKPDVTFRLKI